MQKHLHFLLTSLQRLLHFRCFGWADPTDLNLYLYFNLINNSTNTTLFQLFYICRTHFGCIYLNKKSFIISCWTIKVGSCDSTLTFVGKHGLPREGGSNGEYGGEGGRDREG